jgi:hypothetical protein
MTEQAFQSTGASELHRSKKSMIREEYAAEHRRDDDRALRSGCGRDPDRLAWMLLGTYARSGIVSPRQQRRCGAVGEIEMNADPKRKTHKGDYDRAKEARRHQEEALDDALKNTFPASDPVSIGQPTPPAADHDG